MDTESEKISKNKSKFEEILLELETIKGELHVQAHLFSMETKEDLREILKKLDHLEATTRKLTLKSKSSIDEGRVQCHLLIMEIKDLWHSLSPQIQSFFYRMKKEGEEGKDVLVYNLHEKIKYLQGLFG